ncbi:MAG: ERF family protein [Fluviibacter sp.]
MTSYSESLDQLIPALIAATTEFPAIKKDGYNPHFKSKFASLKAVREATEPILGRHGLKIMQFPSQTYDGKPALTTWLTHTSGQFIRDTTPLSMAKSDPQAQGSAITYLRRYCWSSVLGLVTDEDDDDGNKATISDPAPKASSSRIEKAKNDLRAAIKAANLTREQAAEYSWVAQATDKDYDKVAGLVAALGMGKAVN